MFKRTFDAKNIWQAAYLYVMGLPFLGAYRTPTGKINYEFSNDADRAWQTSLNWYNRGDCTVDGVAFMQAFQLMSQAREAARNTKDSNDDTNNRAA